MKNENLAKSFIPRSEVKKNAEKAINEGINEYRGEDNELQEETEENYRENEIDYRQSESTPEGIISAEEFKDKHPEELYQIYTWYTNAISRRNREPLEKERFISHFFESGSFDTPYMFGDTEKGYLLGYAKYGVFIPTHFAPKSLRKGYELMKELGASEKTPSVMSITEDLVETIKKMPEWRVIDLSFLSQFRNEKVEKMIVHNSHPEVQKLMYGLLDEYLEEKNKPII